MIRYYLNIKLFVIFYILKVSIRARKK